MAVFDNFTNLYSLSKTLRFELKPEGKTLDNMREHLGWNKDLQTFFADQEIEDAYQTLKPLSDKLHEEFINDSLNSEQAKNIDFSEYLMEYKAKKDLQNAEKKLREEVGKAFIEAGEKWKKEKYPRYSWKKGSKVANGSDILLTQDMLELIKDLNSNDQKIKKIIEETFKGFFTYFSGFNQNRDNYYTTKDEKATAVATRIVNENLPKFCDNLIQFEYIVRKKKDGTEERIEKKSEYINAYKYLKDQKKTTQIKDAKSGKMIEAYDIIEGIFQLPHFSSCLSQSGIEEYNRIIGHYNLLINLYNQAKEREERSLDKKERTFKRLPQFKTLYKQIGCGKKDPLFFRLTHDTKAQAQENKEKYNKPYSVEQIIEQAKIAGKKYFQRKSDDGVINAIPEFLEYINAKENYEGVYWSKAALNTISNKYFANYHDLKDRLKAAKVFQKATKGSEENIKIPEVIELEGLFAVLDETDNWKEEDIFFKKSLTEELKIEGENLKNKKRREIIEKAKKPSQALLYLIFSDVSDHIKQFFNTSETIENLKEYKSKDSKEIIKEWMDHALTINQMLKYFLVNENKIKGNPLDSEISNTLKTILFEGTIKQSERDVTVEWFKWYDALRNYLTKKPQDDVKENKLKLNFENSTLAGGWDVNKEPDNYCIILQDQEGGQYLAVIAKQKKQKGYNKIFEKVPNNPLYQIDGDEVWRKMEYKLLPGPNKMLPKCLLPKSNRGKYGANDKILQIYDNGSFKKNEENFSTENLRSLIDFYKSALKKYKEWQCFNFIYKPTNDYLDISQFYSDTEKQGYRLDFIDINKFQLDKYVEMGKIYLFEIKNQDSNDGKKEGHRNNLHTLYWKALFEAIENRPKLNGEAEIFYRKALPVDKQERVKDKSGKEIIKNYRFSKEKFLFHVPITLNFCLKETKINDLVNEKFTKNDDIYFLGIDRGEKHLAYYSFIDQNGKIVDQGTLNLPFTDKGGKPRSIKKQKYFYNKKEDKWEIKEVEGWNYNDLLDAMASNRDMARKNWQTIGTIKELKEGYISQVVRKIADLSTTEDKLVFIVLEDLNTGFKRGRQKIEKSVYQKFELALAKKLNFLVDKSAKNGEIGSVTNALQLTPPVNNYGDIENKKQVGVMFYTRANYTSQTDPVTGWRKTIHLKKGSEANIKEQIIKEFTDIGFDGKDYYFEYVDKNTGKQWRLFSGKDAKSLDRFRGSRGKDKNEWTNEPVDVVNILDQIFINFKKDRSFHSQISDESVEITKISEEHAAWESLRFAIDTIQQIRNTGKDERDNDFILSPVRDENGNHFDSRVASDSQPTSGDANGAFNIARKGMLMSEHIRVWIKSGKPKYDKNPNDLSLLILEDEWDLYLANREEWKKQLDKFSSRKAMEQARKTIV